MGRLRDLSLASAFAVLLLAPAVFALWKPHWSLVPNATQWPLPKEPWRRSFPTQFEKFFDTHLGLRRQLVMAQSALDFFIFRAASSPAVVVGEDGWAFLNQDFMPQSIAGGEFPPWELEQWLSVFKQTQRFVSAWGGQLLVVVAPNKATIYPEHLPTQMRTNRKPPRLDQFYAALNAASIEALDLRPALYGAKSQGLLYGKRETHWVGRGVSVASIAIAEKLCRILGRPPSLTANQISFHSQRHTGDLMSMLALDGWADELVEAPNVTPAKVKRLPLPPSEVSAGQFVFKEGAVVYQAEESDGTSILFHHDSFGPPLHAVLPHAFGRSIWLYWTGSFNHFVLARERPAVVVYLMAERYLHREPPGRPFVGR